MTNAVPIVGTGLWNDDEAAANCRYIEFFVANIRNLLGWMFISNEARASGALRPSTGSEHSLRLGEPALARKEFSA